MTKIAIIGTGYVGLVSGLCFAKIGHDVICVDIDLDKIEQLQKGKMSIYEPGLQEILDEAIANKNISFSVNLADAVKNSEAIFIAVGTPQDKQTGDPDLACVYSVAIEIADNIDTFKTIVTKSTVPVSTNLSIQNIIREINPKADFAVVSNPEFLREGCAIADFLKPDRIVIGVEDDRAKKLMAEIYGYFDNISPIIWTNIATAEMIKYAANSFLAIKICFINDISNLCEKVGADVRQLSKAIGLDSRIGNKFLNPGPGFGGSCFPKDIVALETIARRNDLDLPLVSSAIRSNHKRKMQMAHRIIDASGEKAVGKKIAILGLAFKGNTDDVRHSPALVIIKELLKQGAQINAYDPQAMSNAKAELGENQNICYFQNAYQAIENADFTVIATEWEEFRDLDLARIRQLQNSDLIVDLRNMLDNKKAQELGFKYVGIGSC